jgi:hypothetical protein
MGRAEMLIGLALGLATVGCGGRQVPQHSGYKGKHPTPWTKAKAIELDEEFAAKVSGELDYADYKRSKWFSLTLPGPGSLAFDFEFVPGGDEEMDVAFEVLDPNNQVVVRADAEGDDANEQKKTRTAENLDDGTYLIHVYLQGRLDTADFDLKLKYARGEKAWKSDFPNQVAYLGDLAAVPPFDDTPMNKPTPTPSCGVRGKPACVHRPKPIPEPTPTGLGPISASITNVDPDADGSRITIGAGISDGATDGLSGYVVGVKGGSFRLSGCTQSRCSAKVRAAVDDVRSSGNVVIKR